MLVMVLSIILPVILYIVCSIVHSIHSTIYHSIVLSSYRFLSYWSFDLSINCSVFCLLFIPYIRPSVCHSISLIFLSFYCSVLFYLYCFFIHPSIHASFYLSIILLFYHYYIVTKLDISTDTGTVNVNSGTYD